MYIAKKGNIVCRIPESKAGYYRELGYTLENLDKSKFPVSPKKKTDLPEKSGK